MNDKPRFIAVLKLGVLEHRMNIPAPEGCIELVVPLPNKIKVLEEDNNHVVNPGYVKLRFLRQSLICSCAQTDVHEYEYVLDSIIREI